MRKINSKYEEEKRSRRNALIVGVILICVMFFSVLGYSFNREESSSVEKINYNGFEFVKQNDFWVLEKDNLIFIFKYNPKQVERIYSNLKYLESYSEKPLYILSEDSEAETEIYKNLFYQNQIVQRMQHACLKGEKCEENTPVKTCDDNFIIIKENETNTITQEKNCIFIRGNLENLTELSDEFLFKILRIEQ